MKFNFLHKTFLLLFVTSFLISCDKDFNEIGTDIVNDDHYLFEKDDTKSIVAYNQKIGAVQTNELPVNALGYYNSPVFGKTKASYVTQLELGTLAPTFKSHVVIDSVHLYIPYFSTFKSKDSDTGDSTYELDSIQGNAKIDLQIYENGYFLRDYDPSGGSGLTSLQKYYSDQTPEFDAVKGQQLNTSLLSAENTQFGFNASEVKITYQKVTETGTETVVKERKTPGMSLLLNKNYFFEKIINAPASKLVNNNVFKEYFRGLYFKVNSSVISPEQGSMAMLDFKKGIITISYHQDKVVSPVQSPDSERERKTFVLNLGGTNTILKTVNLFENQNNSVYESAITGSIPPTGQERLYLKGQEGSMTVISLFSPEIDNYGYDVNGVLVTGANGVADELDDLRNPADGKKILINEASITFNIDRDAMLNAPEPNRIMLFDLTNNRPLLDYYNDNSVSSLGTKYNKLIHGGIIEKEDVTDGKGIKYKIRITNHLRSLLKNSDSTNVKLGLVVTESIATITNQNLKNPASTLVKKVPTASVINPRGTVIYGSTKQSAIVPEDKRLKLEIYYTKPD